MKKLVSLLVAAGMLAAPAANVMGAEFVQKDLFSSFDSMLDYTSTSADSNLPNGWTTLRSNPTETERRAALVDNEVIGTTNTLKLTGTKMDNGAAMRFPFSEVVKKGKIHVGFDMKADGQIRLGGHYVLGGNYNPEDYVGADGAGWYVNNTYFVYDSGALNTYQPTNLPENANIKSVAAVSAAAWHRYDVYIDVDAHKYSIFVDGDEKGNYELAMYELKSFWIQCDTGTAYIDNLYMNHYQTDSAFDGMKVACDTVQNGVVNVTFSEPVEAEGVLPGDFSAVNTATKKSYEPTEAELATDNPGYNLTFENLPTGEYEITVSNAYKGGISKTAAENTAKFTVKSDLENTPHYFMNQTFDGYTGGMPIGWHVNNAYYDYGYGDAVNSLYKSADHGDGKALNITSLDSENTIEYKFPTTVYDGEFTIEFDVYRGTGEKWGIGLLTPAEYTNELVDDKGDYTTEWWASDDGIKERRDQLDSRRNNTILFATWNSNNLKSLCYQKGLDTWYNGEFSNISIPESAWTHVKAVIDADACEYRVSVDGGAEQTATGVTRLRWRQLYNVVTDKTENVMGIAGLRLHAGKGSNNVQFDNIKVYSGGNSAYNLYEDFNTLVRPATPYNRNMSNWQFFIDGVTGKSGNTGDKAMKIGFDNPSRLCWQPLSVPVKAGKSFDVEFDIKNETVSGNENGTDGWWVLTLGGENETSADANWVIGYRWNAFKAGTGATTTLQDTNITFDSAKWNHVKLSVIAGANPQLKVTVTNERGTFEYTGAADSKFNTQDTCILGIRNDYNCSSPITIDNLTVKEHNTYAAEILSVKAVDFEGKTADVSGTVSSNAKGLAIKMSRPLANADAVKLYYADNGTNASSERYTAYTKTLADNGSTVNIVFNELPQEGKAVVLGVAQNAEFVDSYLNNFTAAQRTFKIVNEQGQLVVDEFRAYTYVEGRTDVHGQKFEGAWVPYTGESFAGLTDLSKIKLVAKGYNTDADAKIFLSGNDYKVTADGATQMLDGNITTRMAGRGSFEQELDNLPLDAETETFKGMLWTYPGMIPLEKALEYSVK